MAVETLHFQQVGAERNNHDENPDELVKAVDRPQIIKNNEPMISQPVRKPEAPSKQNPVNDLRKLKIYFLSACVH